MLARPTALADGPWDRTRLALAGWALRAHPRQAMRPFCLKLKLGARRTRFWIADIGHLWCLDEVWVAGEYDPIAGGDYDVVLDLGANVGAASIWLHEHHPRARIVAVEPDPRTAELLRRNTGSFERISVLEAAVGTIDGTAQLRSERLSWGAHLDGEPTTGNSPVLEPTSEVEVRTIPALLRDAEVTASERVLAKVDIEGSEWALIQCPDTLSGLTEIYCETHPRGAPAQPGSRLAESCRQAGFESVPAREGFFHWRRPAPRHPGSEVEGGG